MGTFSVCFEAALCNSSFMNRVKNKLLRVLGWFGGVILFLE